MAMLAI